MRDARQWAHTRFIGHYLHSKITGKFISPEELVPLLFDDKKSTLPKAAPITKEEVKDFEQKWLTKK